MNSLFWKIFLWFWVAMITMGGAIAWTTAQLKDLETENVTARAYKHFQEDAAEAAFIVERYGVSAFGQWLEDPKHTRSMDIYLVNINGIDQFGRPIPPRLRPLVFSRWTPKQQTGRAWFIMRDVNPPNHRPYRLLATFIPPHPLLLLLTPGRIAVALLVSALVCLWLARHITRPVLRLRTATQKFSAGDLDVRVGKGMDQRNDEIGGLARDFDYMAERLQCLISSQEQLISDVSHELRSPLARLHVALELARQRSGDTATAELDRIEREGERLNELIGQMLSLARMESSAQKIEMQPVALPALLKAIIQDAEYEARTTNRHVTLTKISECTVMGNAALLHSAIENVVRNALKYTDDDSSVELALTLKDGREGSPEQQICILVRDYGPGVPDEALTRLFEPFVRVNTARDRDSGGYGLGLAIAERAITLHKGCIQARNAVDGGLIIEISLPAHV